MNSQGKRYPTEVRERAVRMVLEHQDEHDDQLVVVPCATIRHA